MWWCCRVTSRSAPARPSSARHAPSSDRLGAPVLAVPGNHDIPLFDLWARLRRPYARYTAAFGADLEPVHRSPDLWWCASTPRGPGATRMVRYPRLQIDRVARLAGARRACAVARGGGAPARGRDPRRGRPNLSARPCGRAASAGRPPAPTSSWAGTSTCPTSWRCKAWRGRLWVVQAGTAVSSRVREGAPNSVNLLRWGAGCERPGCCRIERWGLLADRAVGLSGRDEASFARRSHPCRLSAIDHTAVPATERCRRSPTCAVRRAARTSRSQLRIFRTETHEESAFFDSAMATKSSCCNFSGG